MNVSSVAMSAGDCFIGLFYLKGRRGADLPVGFLLFCVSHTQWFEEK